MRRIYFTWDYSNGVSFAGTRNEIAEKKNCTEAVLDYYDLLNDIADKFLKIVEEDKVNLKEFGDKYDYPDHRLKAIGEAMTDGYTLLGLNKLANNLGYRVKVEFEKK